MNYLIYSIISIEKLNHKMNCSIDEYDDKFWITTGRHNKSDKSDKTNKNFIRMNTPRNRAKYKMCKNGTFKDPFVYFTS